MSAQTGKESGQNGTEHQKGKVYKYAGYRSNQVSNKELSQIVGDGTGNTGEEDIMSLQKSVGKIHHKETAQATHKAVEQT